MIPYNLRFVRVAAGTTRMGLALVFPFFHALTLVAFAAALALSRLRRVFVGRPFRGAWRRG